MHRLMDPCRDLVWQRGSGRSTIVWRRSLRELEDFWQRLQHAVKEMWEITGHGRSTAPLQRIRALYQSHADKRMRHLQYWEREHMGMHDKNQHRPARLRLRGCKRQALGKAVAKLPLVRKLLLRWRNALMKQEQRTENLRCKKEQAERRQRAAWKRKRAREEEWLRRKCAREEQAAKRLRSRVGRKL